MMSCFGMICVMLRLTHGISLLTNCRTGPVSNLSRHETSLVFNHEVANLDCCSIPYASF
jgi:hypothetical protein